MDAEKKVTSCHQRPADRAPFEIDDRDANAVREGAGSVQHGEALQQPARRERNKVDRETDHDEPEVPGDCARPWPGPSGGAWQHVVDRAEHDEREETISTEMRMYQGVVCVVCKRIHAAQGYEIGRAPV